MTSRTEIWEVSSPELENNRVYTAYSGMASLRADHKRVRLNRPDRESAWAGRWRRRWYQRQPGMGGWYPATR